MLCIGNRVRDSSPVAGWTAFQTISVRRQRLIRRGSIRASARSLTLAARSAWRPRPEQRKQTLSWNETQYDELTDLVCRQILWGMRLCDGPDKSGDGQSSENEHRHWALPPSALAAPADRRRLPARNAPRSEAIHTRRSSSSDLRENAPLSRRAASTPYLAPMASRFPISTAPRGRPPLGGRAGDRLLVSLLHRLRGHPADPMM
jgi:hypothetical protein